MKTSRGWKIAALVPLALATAILFLFGFGEMIGGDWSGISHLVPAALMLSLMWVGWKRPWWAGIVLIVLGILAFVYFFPSVRRPMGIGPLLVFVAPPLISGLLFLAAARSEGKSGG